MANIYTDFTRRDFTSNFERLLNILSQELPEYTDRNHSDAGIALIRLLARETDMLSFYIDEAFIESFLPTARFKQSLIDISTTVGYAPVLASAAASLLRLARLDGVTHRILIPRFTVFNRTDGVQYISLAATAINLRVPYIDVRVMQGEAYTISLGVGDFIVDAVTRKLKYNLGPGVAYGTVELMHTDESVVWTQVDSFWRSTSTDWHYMLELDGETDDVYLVIGDGIQGSLLDYGNIDVTYITTDGAIGNCGTGVITITPSYLKDFISCTNIEAANGGASSEGVESIRESVPLVTRAQRRGVIKEDYQALIEHLPGILHCQIVDRNNSLNWPHLYVILYIVPDGGGAVTTPMRDMILDACTSWGHLGTWSGRYIVQDWIEHLVDVSVRIGVLSGYEHNSVVAAVYAACEAFFAPANQGLAQDVDFGDLNIALSRVNGVSWIEFDAPVVDVDVIDGEMAVVGTITITVQE